MPPRPPSAANNGPTTWPGPLRRGWCATDIGLRAIVSAAVCCNRAIARPNQLPPPGDWWQIWLLFAGRGFGKTRTLAEWVCPQAASGQADRISLVAASRRKRKGFDVPPRGISDYQINWRAQSD